MKSGSVPRIIVSVVVDVQLLPTCDRPISDVGSVGISERQICLKNRVKSIRTTRSSGYRCTWLRKRNPNSAGMIVQEKASHCEIWRFPSKTKSKRILDRFHVCLPMKMRARLKQYSCTATSTLAVHTRLERHVFGLLI